MEGKDKILPLTEAEMDEASGGHCAEEQGFAVGQRVNHLLAPKGTPPFLSGSPQTHTMMDHCDGCGSICFIIDKISSGGLYCTLRCEKCGGLKQNIRLKTCANA